MRNKRDYDFASVVVRKDGIIYVFNTYKTVNFAYRGVSALMRAFNSGKTVKVMDGLKEKRISLAGAECEIRKCRYDLTHLIYDGYRF